MKKGLLYILFATTLSLPAVATERSLAIETETEEAAMLSEKIVVSFEKNTLRVQRAEGYTVYIYNITGVKVASYKVDSAEKTITLNLEKGYYIVKVGDVARRILVR